MKWEGEDTERKRGEIVRTRCVEAVIASGGPRMRTKG